MNQKDAYDHKVMNQKDAYWQSKYHVASKHMETICGLGYETVCTYMSFRSLKFLVVSLKSLRKLSGCVLLPSPQKEFFRHCRVLVSQQNMFRHGLLQLNFQVRDILFVRRCTVINVRQQEQSTKKKRMIASKKSAPRSSLSHL